MADFEYVEWTGKTPVSDDRLTKMSENDQHLYDRLLAMPQGVIGWARRNTDRQLGDQAVGTWTNTSGLSVEVEIEEDRLIKVTYRCNNIDGGPAKGLRTLAARVVMDGASVFATHAARVEQNYIRGFPAVIGVKLATAGTHTFQVQHRIAQGQTTGASFSGSTQVPQQLIIEDVGAYIDPE